MTLAASSAQAQAVDEATRGAARQLGYSGVEAYQAGDYKTASTRLEKAYLVLRVPSLGLWSARALVKNGKLVEARERYVEVGSLPTEGGDAQVQEDAKREAKVELDALVPRVPNLVIVLEGAQPNEVTVYVDGAPLAAALVGEQRPINPGRHRIGGKRGTEQAEVEVDVAEGSVGRAVLRFASGAGAAGPTAVAPTMGASNASGASVEDSGAASDGTRRLIAWVAIGVGAAGLVTGGITGAMVLSKKSDLESNENCANEACLSSERSEVDGYNGLRTISTVSLIAGGALAATGVVLLVTAPSSEKPSAALVIRPGSLSLRGRF